MLFPDEPIRRNRVEIIQVLCAKRPDLHELSSQSGLKIEGHGLNRIVWRMLRFLIIAAMASLLPSANPPVSYLGVHAINVYVRDQERSLRFYVDKLGFQIAFDGRRDSGERLIAVAPPDGTAVLALIQPDPSSPQYRLIGRSMHVVLVTDDVLGRYREWLGRGVRFRYTPRLRRVVYHQVAPSLRNSTDPSNTSDGQAAVWGGVFTRFEDIDRNSFELVSLDEISRSIERQRRAAAEKQEAERRARHELEIARQVQARLFPQTLPLLRSLEYAGACVQTRQVGGDYYDFLDLGQERLGLVIGDIAGKGIAAALLMANLQANLRSQCAIAVDKPEQLLRSVNRLFHDNTAENAYATLFYSEFDDKTRRLRYANCGHLPCLVLHADASVERLPSTAPVVGLFADWQCPTEERQLLPDDIFAIYTDGITESFNDQEEEFGEDRLIDALRRHRELSPNDVIAAVFDEVRQFSRHEQRDDFTLIVAKCRDCTGQR
jgi:serine phosphatase RsbU (regulator of sigma subunit)/catechol 2,3-dioxygenase-like lactoylglutathione lyase family enzyme